MPQNGKFIKESIICFFVLGEILQLASEPKLIINRSFDNFQIYYFSQNIFFSILENPLNKFIEDE